MKKLLLLMVFVSLLAGCGKGNSGYSNEQIDSFSKCVNSGGAIIYGQVGCSHCEDQKAVFGDSIKNLKYIDCRAESTLCDLKQIQGTPTRIFGDGTRNEGFMTLEQIASKTSCSLK